MTALTIAPENRTRQVGVDISSATTVEEALVMADLNWGLTVRPAENMSIMTEDGIIATSIPGQRLVMRDDNYVTLGAVGGRYNAIDNRKVFELAQPILDRGGRFLEAGQTDHGRKTFMRLDLPDATVEMANGKDLIKFDIVIKASHDGSGNVQAGLEGTRLVCTNGMVTNMKGLPHTFKVRHTANAMRRMEETETILAGAFGYVKGFTAATEHMISTKMTGEEFTTFIDNLFSKPELEEGRGFTMWKNRRDALIELFHFAETNNLHRGTRMGAYNSLTEWASWGSVVRSHDDMGEMETRALRHLDATFVDINTKAFEAPVSA